MYIIKLGAIESTNSFLKDMTATKIPKDYTVVVAEHQTQGRGQMGTVWNAEDGKNLTMSVFKIVSKFKVDSQYYISMVVALAVHDALLSFNIPRLSIKWPNDILSENKKICGILIENVIKNNSIQGTVIGIGLNVNQKNFEGLPKASSLSLITGVIYNKDEILSEILSKLKWYFNSLKNGEYDIIQIKYESLLFRKEKPSTFKLSNDSIITGIIKGVSKDGKLNVWLEDDIIQSFDLKEIELLY
ncbi:MAG: biotin--[acetyl-CoA-carboxylase] ligase [Winogradskyella sp.]|uniref:biotin--[acetyl-CoA-carboxylase] ligase n=1 Tax=Winogradskyella sp. TaxID=1883156 RepID=UPI0025D8F810|nr:biotin--[acetyl-CoA-carboxylase] ligase [Winogradskyella sp.]NRB58423.1 biotin--[acetyl-CoA-carboxylase] ligase [Winogradskyella sp.]